MAQTWNQFNRFPHAPAFFGVVDKEGCWVDSATSFAAACRLGCMYMGEHDRTELAEMQTVLAVEKLSIVHSDLLKVMFAAGLLK